MKYLDYTYLALIFSGFIFGLVHYRKLRRASRFLTQFMGITFITEIYIFLPFSWVTTNLPLYHVYAMVSMLYFGFIFHAYLVDYPRLRKAILYTSFFFALLSLLNTVFLQSFFTHPTRGIILVSLLSVPSALIYFFLMVKDPVKEIIFKQPPFWFNSGTLFFYSLNIFILGYLFNSSFSQEIQVTQWANMVVKLSSFLLYGCYFVSIFQDSKLSKELI